LYLGALGRTSLGTLKINGSISNFVPYDISEIIIAYQIVRSFILYLYLAGDCREAERIDQDILSDVNEVTMKLVTFSTFECAYY
jgi:hypothetical protein